MVKKKEPWHFVNAEMMADYLDEHNGELPHARDGRVDDPLNYGCASIDDIDRLVKHIYGDV